MVQLDRGARTTTFGLNLPVGAGQGDVPRLLEHVATTLRNMNVKDEDILGIAFQYGEVDEAGELLPGFIVTVADAAGSS